jgi:hypothetical protein
MRKKKLKAWVNPESTAFAFLPKQAKKAAGTAQRKAKPTKAEQLRETRSEELDTLDHDIAKARRGCSLAELEWKTTAAREGITGGTHQNEVAAEPLPEHVEAALREREINARFGQEIVAKAKSEAIKIYGRLNMSNGEKRARIRAVLESYNVDESILPTAIKDLMDEEENYASE